MILRIYTIAFNNAFYYPHSGHNESAGGVIASTGFYISGDATNIQYFDDDFVLQFNFKLICG